MIELELYYLGERDYVNGLTLFEEMIAAYLGQTPTPEPIRRVRSFKIHRFVRCQGSLVIRPQSDAPVADPAAHMVIETGRGETQRLELVEHLDRPEVERRSDYDRSVYIAGEDERPPGWSAADLAAPSDPFALVRGIVETNHRYCIRQAAKMGVTGRVSWGYLTNFPWPVQELIGSYGRVELSTKSVIRHNRQVYEIRKLEVVGLTEGTAAEICFFWDDPGSDS